MFDVDDDRNPEEKKNGFVFDAIDEGVSTRAIDGITFGRERCCISLAHSSYLYPVHSSPDEVMSKQDTSPA